MNTAKKYIYQTKTHMQIAAVISSGNGPHKCLPLQVPSTRPWAVYRVNL